MKSFKIFLLFLTVGLTSIIFTSCNEEQENEVDGIGSNFIRLPDAGASPVVIGVDAKPGVVIVPIAEILRDANSESSLQQPVNVTLQLDQAAIDAYNAGLTGADTADRVELLPASLYQADPLQVNFAAGDFSKFFNIKLDPLKLDLSKKYAIALKVASADGGYQLRNGQTTALYTFVVKNEYDGTYHSTGFFTHPTPTSSRAIDRDKTLTTVSANTVITELGDLGGAGYEMLITVNADNSVTLTKSGATPNIDQTSYTKNYYDPADGSFHLHYSYNVAAPRIIMEVIAPK